MSEKQLLAFPKRIIILLYVPETGRDFVAVDMP